MLDRIHLRQTLAITSSARPAEKNRNCKRQVEGINDGGGGGGPRSRRDVSGAGADRGSLSPDLLAACKDNDPACVRALLADGVPPGYIDPESGMEMDLPCDNLNE